VIVVFTAMGVETRACVDAVGGAQERDAGDLKVMVSGDFLVCQTGIGRRAQGVARSLLQRLEARYVLSVGTAGGLAPDVQAGDVVCCERVVHAWEQGEVAGDEELAAAALECARGLGCSHQAGVSVTVDRVAWTPRDKAVLRKSSGADIVEMESFWIGRAANEKGLPFLAVRAVSDDASNALVEVPGAIDDEGNIDGARVLAYTQERPEVIPLLARQHELGGRALAALSRFLAVFLPRLAPPAV